MKKLFIALCFLACGSLAIAGGITKAHKKVIARQTVAAAGCNWTAIWCAGSDGDCGTSDQTGANMSNGTYGTTYNIRNILEVGQIEEDATVIRALLYANASKTLVGVSICEQSSGDTCDATPIRFQTGGTDITSGNTMTIDGTGAYTDALTFTIDKTGGKSYLLHIYDDVAMNDAKKWDEGSGTNTYINGGSDDTLTIDPGTSANDSIILLKQIEECK